MSWDLVIVNIGNAVVKRTVKHNSEYYLGDQSLRSKLFQDTTAQC